MASMQSLLHVGWAILAGVGEGSSEPILSASFRELAQKGAHWIGAGQRCPLQPKTQRGQGGLHC